MSKCECNLDTKNNTGVNKKEPITKVVASDDTIEIQLLYLDLEVCEPCQQTDNSLESALTAVSNTLQALGYKINLQKIHINSVELAIENTFRISPTIRVSGQDLQFDYKEDHCSSCSSLSKGRSVYCRTWVYDGKEYQAPPKQMIIDSVMQIISRDKNDKNADTAPYELPDNLRNFFKNIGSC